jgi:hypothetical protein
MNAKRKAFTQVESPYEGKRFYIPIMEVKRQPPPTLPKYPFYLATDEKGIHTAVFIDRSSQAGDVFGVAYPLRPDAIQMTGGAHNVSYHIKGVPTYFKIGQIRSKHPSLKLAAKMPEKIKLMGDFSQVIFYGLKDFLKIKQLIKFPPPYTPEEVVLSANNLQRSAINNCFLNKLANKLISFLYRDMKSAMDQRLISIANRFPFKWMMTNFTTLSSLLAYEDEMPFFQLEHGFQLEYTQYNVYVALCLYGLRFEQMCNTYPYLAKIAITKSEIMKMIVDGKKVKDIVDQLISSRRSITFMSQRTLLYTRHLKPQLTGKNFSHNHACMPESLVPQKTDSLNVQRLKIYLADFFAPAIIQFTSTAERDQWVKLPKELIDERIDPLNRRLTISHEDFIKYQTVKVKRFANIMATIIEKFANKRQLPPELEGGLREFLTHVIDWAIATNQQFDKHISPERVIEKIREWDQEIRLLSSKLELDDVQFPTPWLKNSEFTLKSKKYEMTYIATNHALKSEGLTMHHCVSSYSNKIQDGFCQIYSLKAEEKHIATIEIERTSENTYAAVQIRGKKNSHVDQTIVSKINRIIKKHNEELTSSSTLEDQSLPSLAWA